MFCLFNLFFIVHSIIANFRLDSILFNNNDLQTSIIKNRKIDNLQSTYNQLYNRFQLNGSSNIPNNPGNNVNTTINNNKRKMSKYPSQNAMQTNGRFNIFIFSCLHILFLTIIFLLFIGCVVSFCWVCY